MCSWHRSDIKFALKCEVYKLFHKYSCAQGMIHTKYEIVRSKGSHTYGTTCVKFSKITTKLNCDHNSI